MSSSTARQVFSGFSGSTFLLAFASFFADVSTEMLYPVLPVFLTQTLHATGSIVGLVEGFAQAAQHVAQGFSGALSDSLQKRKMIALVGYLMAAIGKPLMGVAAIWPELFGARLLDRLGSGIRSAPRDALIASSVSDENRGRAFGLEGLGDNAGAFVGPILAAVLLYSVHADMRTIFYAALVPGVLAFLMVLLVTERPAIRVGSKSRIDASIWRFPKAYWTYLLVVAFFNIGNSSNSFLVLRTQDFGAPLEITILIYAGFNFVAALVSYPAGALSDRFGRKTVLLASFATFGATYLGFALATNIATIAGLFVLYGLYEGIFRAVGKAFASDFVPHDLRAGGIGWFSATVGLLQLIASVVAGLIWDKIDHAAVFYYGAGSAVLGGLALLWLIPSQRKPEGKESERGAQG